MSPRIPVGPVLFAGLLAAAASAAETPTRSFTRTELADRIRGAWAGQMIGVVYGAPTEFHSLGHIIEGEMAHAPMDNAIDQDDLYVEMTFARVMDTIGLDATTADYGEAFRTSRYQLWHANAAARRNLNRGLAAPLSGDPRYSLHTDDIDFQIEADFIGIMCPGLPRSAGVFADRVGSVMNRGDGLYGGHFVSAMYCAAYFERDPRRIVEAGLAAMPPDSEYAAVIRDVLAWSRAEPADWRKVWHQLEERWDRDDICPDGAFQAFNIDAKLNGAYIALGLLYGGGDWDRTLEIATRCGQDSDCNPSSAAGILGALHGWSGIPARYRDAITPFADKKFSFTDYSFNDIVASTEKRALAVIARAGGKVDDASVHVPLETPQPPAATDSGYGRPVRLIAAQDAAWHWQGDWRAVDGWAWSDKRIDRVSHGPGNEATLEFTGTGLGLVGNLGEDGGRAEVYIDGQKSELLADAYLDAATHDDDLWRIRDLAPGPHTLRLVTLPASDPRSHGERITISGAIVFEKSPSRSR